MAGGKLRVICGPTAAGKSGLAFSLAERIGAVIVSADARQIYRGFDIGTAKPANAERARVPHRGIDVADPVERYSAGRWAESAREWISRIRAEGREPVVVGGAGFYLRALAAPLFNEPTIDPARHHAIQQELQEMTTSELRRWCQRLDPARAHLGRTQLLRALEVALLTGIPISRWHACDARPPALPARYLVVDPGAELRDRIDLRLDGMLRAGWEAEVAALDDIVPEHAPAWKATGYSTVRALVRGQLRRARAIEGIRIDTRRYAKRQRTWFRHQLPTANVTHLDPTSSDAFERALAWWDEDTARRSG